MLEICLLGQFDLRRNGAPVEIPSRSAQSLLAYLVLNPGIAHRREKLAGLIWPDATEANARNYLRKALWLLRKSMAVDTLGGEEYLIADDISITFKPDANYWLDADAVRSKSTSVEDQIKVVSVYQGELLPGFYEEWVILERDRLKAAFNQKINTLLSCLVAEEEWEQVIYWGEQWIALGEAPEPAFRALMVAHANVGDMAKVAVTYERCVQTLREELEVEPSEQTTELFQQLREGMTIPGDKSAATFDFEKLRRKITSTPAEMEDQQLTNLPIPLTSFIGREEEISEIKRLLEESRLLTLAGAGGSGKTRLAIRVGGEVRNTFSDGVWWIELADLVDPQLVPQAVAKVLRILEVPDQSLSDTLTSALRSRQILLVFDCCEHLLDASAQLAEHLLKACPELKILATSREVLDVAGECIFHVPTMSSPDPDRDSPSDFLDYDAVCLFIERAAAIMPDFAMTSQNAPAIGQLCHGLDGIPLAIELAAARVQALKVEQIASRLDDRFLLLTGGSRTAMPRHQTLRATLDWSYDLLSDSERKMLQRLSIFTGGWSAVAAESICIGGEIRQEDVLDLLFQLVSKSLVMTERKLGEEARYRMLETIREYAIEKLIEAGEETAVRDRHLDFFVMLAEEAEPQLFKLDQVSWFNRLEAEHENLRAAVTWSLKRKAATSALRLVGALSWFWQQRGHYREVLELSSQILASPNAMERTAARAKALSIDGLVQWMLGKEADARSLLEEALDISTEIGDQPNIAFSRVFLGVVISTHSDQQQGLLMIEEGLKECQALGSAGQPVVGFALNFLGDGSFYQGNYQRAQELYQKGVDVLSEVQDLNFLAYSHRRLGHIACYKGDLDRAANRIHESLSLNMKLGHQQGITACVSGLACVELARGKALAAAQLFAAVERQLEKIEVSLLPSDTIEFERNVARAREELGETKFAAAWAKGRTMTLDQAIELAVKQTAV